MASLAGRLSGLDEIDPLSLPKATREPVVVTPPGGGGRERGQRKRRGKYLVATWVARHYRPLHTYSEIDQILLLK